MREIVDFLLVGVAGFEPATTRTPSVCATRLRYTPTVRRGGAKTQIIIALAAKLPASALKARSVRTV